MSESCNSRSFSWLMKSCFPNPQQEPTRETTCLIRLSDKSPPETRHKTTLQSLPDDLLLECLCRLPTSFLPSVSLVCHKWSHLIDSTSFYDLRRVRGHLRRTLFAISATDSGVFAANHRIGHDTVWNVTSFHGLSTTSPEILDGSFGHTRMIPIGRWIYLLGRNATVRYDTWTKSFSSRSPMLFPRKKFAAAAIAGKIYVSGGATRTLSVEEYNPETDTWRILTESSRRRYGCIGAGVDGIFYVIGGFKIGSRTETRGTGIEPHVYASSMDLCDVNTSVWLKSRTVPGGGFVVAACAAGGHVYILASHAVELSFWRFNAHRKSGGGFGEWCKMKSPPLPAQVRLDGTVRFSFVGDGENVVLVQVMGCIDDLLRRSGRSCRGLKEGLVMAYDSGLGEWNRVADLPEIIRRAACACVEC